MSEWKEYLLSDVADVTSSKRIFYSDYVEAGVPFWRSKEIIEKFNRKPVTTELFISEDKYEEIRTKYGVPNPGDILLTSVGTLGIPYLVKPGDRFYFKDGNLTWIRKIDKEILLPEYLYFWLCSNIGQSALSEIAIGSTQEALTIVGLKGLILLLPPLPEQKAIAEVLSSIDDKIDLLHRQNKTLEEMAMTLFRQWFIEPTKDGLPEGWEEVNLGEIVKISSGKGLNKKDFVENGLYPVLGSNGEIGRTNNFLFNDKLIFTGRVGTLGNVFISEGKVWLSDNTLVVKPISQEYFYFVYFFLKMSKLEELNVGSTQPLIRQTDLKELDIIIPDKETINKFHKFVEQIFNKIKYNKHQIRTSEQLRDTLLPKLMSGEVRVMYVFKFIKKEV